MQLMSLLVEILSFYHAAYLRLNSMLPFILFNLQYQDFYNTIKIQIEVCLNIVGNEKA